MQRCQICHLQHYLLFGKCVKLWHCSVDLSVKDFPHMLQVNGFSPVWILTCLVRSCFCLNIFIQYWHWLRNNPPAAEFESPELFDIEVYSPKLCFSESDCSKVRCWYSKLGCRCVKIAIGSWIPFPSPERVEIFIL